MVSVLGRRGPTFQAACLLPAPSGHRCTLTLRSPEACPPGSVPSEKTTAVTAVPSQPGRWLLWRTFPCRSILFIYFAMTLTGLSFLIVFTECCCHQYFPVILHFLVTRLVTFPLRSDIHVCANLPPPWAEHLSCMIRLWACDESFPQAAFPGGGPRSTAINVSMFLATGSCCFPKGRRPFPGAPAMQGLDRAFPAPGSPFFRNLGSTFMREDDG